MNRHFFWRISPEKQFSHVTIVVVEQIASSRGEDVGFYLISPNSTKLIPPRDRQFFWLLSGRSPRVVSQTTQTVAVAVVRVC